MAGPVGPSPQYLTNAKKPASLPTSMTPTNPNFNFTTDSFNYSNREKFGSINSGKLLPQDFLPTSNGYIWNLNGSESAPIALIGDKTGKYIASSITTAGLSAGSPLDLNEAAQQIVNQRLGNPGEMAALKQMLADKQFYSNERGALVSLSTGDDADMYFNEALIIALTSATATNQKMLAQGQSILTFDNYLANAAVTGMWGTTSIGGGDNTRTVQHVKFKTEDFDIAIDQLFQQTIGRGASDQELKDFVSKLQAYEQENPQVTTTTGPASNRTSVTSGGVDSAIVQSQMRDTALANPEAENYNKGTKYLSYFQEALKAPKEFGQ